MGPEAPCNNPGDRFLIPARPFQKRLVLPHDI